jgi:hypothetical protein
MGTGEGGRSGKKEDRSSDVEGAGEVMVCVMTGSPSDRVRGEREPGLRRM